MQVIECKGYKRIQFYERKLFLANIVSIFISIFFLIDVNKRNEPINRWLYLLGGAYSVVWLIAGGLNLLLNSNQSVELKKIEDGVRYILIMLVQAFRFSRLSRAKANHL